MKIDVKMPKLGESLTEGTVLKWWKKEGEAVKKDEILLEVTTDKVDSEIPSPADGILTKIVAHEQEVVAVDGILAQLETAAGSEMADNAEKNSKSSKKTIKESEKKPAEAATPPVPARKGAAFDVVMPKMGESLTEGTILKWWKQPGDFVKKDETLLEISTDKVDSEIPSPVSGKVQEILVKENETVEVGHIIARVESADKDETGVIEKSETEPKDGGSQPERLAPPSRDQVLTEPIPVKGEDNRFYSPLVRNIAQKENVSSQELAGIAGSGHGNRVTKKDILNYLKKGRVKPAQLTVSGERLVVIPMDNVRKKIAEHMRFSLDTSAHVYSVSECDVSGMMNLLAKYREEFQKLEGFKLTVTPFFLHAVAKSLLDFPRVNASLDGDRIIEKRDINIGIAVAAPRGLIVPVIKNAEEKSFTGLARSANDLVTRARENKLTYEDIEGSTFSVTNYGIFGNIIGLPIINQPNVAILGIGAIKKRPVVIESPEGDAIGIRSMVYVSMSYDHRLIDGELGGRFMQRLVEYLENIDSDIF